MFLGFGLLFIVSFVTLRAVERFGLPFSGFNGVVEERRSEVFRGLKLTADLKKERLTKWVEERRDDSAVLAASPLMQSQVARLRASIEDLRAEGRQGEALWEAVADTGVYRDLVGHLRLVQESYEVYRNIQIAEAGTKIVIAGTDAADLGGEVFSPGYFEEAVEKGGILAGVWREEKDGEIHLHIMRLMADRTAAESRGAALGDTVFIMHVSTDDFIAPILHTGGGLGETGEALIVDSEVRILTSLKHPLADGSKAKPMEYRIKALPATLAARGEEGIVETEDYRGEDVLAAYRYIPVTADMGWGMVVKRDKDEVFAQFRRTDLTLGLLAVAGVFVILGITHLTARNLTRPVVMLSETARKVREGDLDARGEVAGTDEIRELAADFNAMVERVQNWNRDLDEQVRRRTLELKGKNEELGREVKARERVQEAREELNRALMEKNEELEQVINVTSHDLRSPLVNIHGFARELGYLMEEVSAICERKDLPPEVAGELRRIVGDQVPEMLRFILRGASKMDRLIQGLLRISRLGRAALEIKELDMDSLMSEIADSVEFQLQESGVTLDIDPLPPCLGDEMQVNQVFSNLLDNALKYLDPDRAGVIRVTGRADGDRATYCVSDNGIGIDPAYFDKIFDIFHRLNPRATTGDGLGLTTVKRILDRQNGTVMVESSPGGGCLFSVSLPLAGGDSGKEEI
jgi:signal transduction histidine kinase